MEKKRAFNLSFTIIAIILGVAIFKQIDVEQGKIEKPALTIVYGIGFVIAVIGALGIGPKK